MSSRQSQYILSKFKTDKMISFLLGRQVKNLLPEREFILFRFVYYK